MKLRDRYGIVLGLLILAYVLDADRDQVAPRVLSALVFAGLVLLALVAPETPRPLRVAGLVGLVSVVILYVVASATGSDEIEAAALLTGSAVLLVTVLTILIRIASQTRVEVSTVMGAIVAYMLLGFVAGFTYFGIDLLTDEPFFAQSETVTGSADAASFTYFSFVTLTTLGYGDLTPGTELGERLVVVEALVGQLFLVVLLARLVSLWRRPERGVAPAAESPGSDGNTRGEP